jgi:aminoglycoside 6'-N-acetyltransferase I
VNFEPAGARDGAKTAPPLTRIVSPTTMRDDSNVIREATEEDFGEWLRMRILLYPDCKKEELLAEIQKIFRDRTLSDELDYTILVHEREKGHLGGFVETSLRLSVPFCHTSPVGFIESFYVDVGLRKRGIGRRLLEESEKWAKHKGCTEMAVDTNAWRKENPQNYRALGFMEVHRNDRDGVLFKKQIVHENET